MGLRLTKPNEVPDWHHAEADSRPLTLALVGAGEVVDDHVVPIAT